MQEIQTELVRIWSNPSPRRKIKYRKYAEAASMTTRLLLSSACFLVLLASMSAGRAAGPAAVEREITHLEQDFNYAYAKNDLDKFYGYYSEDLVAIFYNARSTLADYRKTWTESVRAGNPVVSVKISDLVVLVSPAGDSAIASYQIDVRNGHADGRTTDEHAFETDVWFKRAGVWKVVHEHYSLATPPAS